MMDKIGDSSANGNLAHSAGNDAVSNSGARPPVHARQHSQQMQTPKPPVPAQKNLSVSQRQPIHSPAIAETTGDMPKSPLPKRRSPIFHASAASQKLPETGVPNAVNQHPQSQPKETLPSQNHPQPQISADAPIDDNAKTCAISVSQETSNAQFRQPSSEISANAAPANQSGDTLSAEPEITDIPQATLPIGMKIDDRYEIQGVLGAGGFATVYCAHHLSIDRDVALKVMDLKKGVDPSYSERFFREAKIAAKIHHNNVVSIYDFGFVAETSQPYIAMEMLRGHDLSRELAQRGPLSPRRAFVLFRPVLEALSQGHRLGIVHKDLKPENLYLVDPGGQRELMKILDFGVARVNSSEVAKLTSAGQLLGTPRYLAPEYIKTQNVSPAIDVYQMALILSEALTGIPAVSGDPFHAMMLHCSGQLQIADFLLEGPVGDVFRKAIDIDPAMRYQDCEAFGNALDSVAEYFSSDVPLKGGAPQLTPDSRTSSNLTLMPLSGKTTGRLNPANSGQNQQPPRKKSKLPIAVLILFVIFAILGGLYLFYQKQQADLLAAKKAEEELKIAAKKAEPKLKFAISSSPEGARVLRNGTRTLCDKTPCTLEFKKSELAQPPLIVFKLGGYKPANMELTTDTFKRTGGKIIATLEKESPKDLKFEFEYEPASATAIEFETGKPACPGSPCPYVFDVERTAVKLVFSADGYISKTVAVSVDNYTGKPIVFKLEKKNVIPAKNTKNSKKSAKSAQNAPPNSATSAKQTAQPQKTEKKSKPEIKLGF